jgi:hypothetical protein
MQTLKDLTYFVILLAVFAGFPLAVVIANLTK